MKHDTGHGQGKTKINREGSVKSAPQGGSGPRRQASDRPEAHPSTFTLTNSRIPLIDQILAQLGAVLHSSISYSSTSLFV